ncbi:protein arv1 [Populus alba x Populus x berolinensis]|uniref:Protein ARV n=1 Tax=Populus alba x Populus x berolinensis TaxID=444605 RepID=A0AAD6RG10_9ROSI|nr:protein arv1 [Populus alba x Populus x berolinensis]
MEHRCVECGFPIETLFLQYSPGNIRLLRCANCEAVADEYIECEFMIILIDLILHKTKAYRHLLFSVINQRRVNFEVQTASFSYVYFLQFIGCFAGFVMEVNLCVSSFGCLYPFLVLVIFFEYLNTPLNLWYEMVLYALMIKDRSLLLKKNEGEWGSSMKTSIVSTFQEILVDVFVGNFMFICVFLLSMRLLLNTSIQISRCRGILLAVLVSSHFKIFLIATMVWLLNVWEFPFSVIFIIDLFVLSSNTVALKG